MGEGTVPPPWRTARFPAAPHIDPKCVKSALQPALGCVCVCVCVSLQAKGVRATRLGGGNAQTGLILEVRSEHGLQERPLVKQL